MKAILRRLIALALFAAAAQASAQDVGRVMLAAGDAVAVRGNQTIRLVLGSGVQEKDILRTGLASNLQVRFIDESITSLRENSELLIDQFRFSGMADGNERAFFRLVKGGLRTVTGLVGRTNTKNYGLSTITATIGIRGSDFGARECANDCPKADGTQERNGLFGSVYGPSHGTNRVNVNNQADPEGRTFGMNEHFFVADPKSPIERLLVPPEVVANRLEGRGKSTAKSEGTGSEQTAGGTAADSRGTTDVAPPPTLPGFVVTENRDSSGGLAVVPGGGTPTIAGVGALTNFFFNATDEGGAFFAPTDLTTEPAGASANLATDQKLLAFTVQPGFEAHATPNTASIFGSASSSASVIDETGGANGIGAHWGRWTSGSVTDGEGTHTINSTNQFHYLYGPLAPSDVVAAKSGTFNMTLVGGTTPTNNQAETGTFIMAALTVNFTARTVTVPPVTMNFTQQAWAFNGATTPINIVAGKGAFIDQSVSGSCVGTFCTSGTANLGQRGIFMGPNGDHLSIAFQARATAGTAGAQTAKIFSCSPNC